MATTWTGTWTGLDQLTQAAGTAMDDWTRAVLEMQPTRQLSDTEVLERWMRRKRNPAELQMIAERYGTDELTRYVNQMLNWERWMAARPGGFDGTNYGS